MHCIGLITSFLMQELNSYLSDKVYLVTHHPTVADIVTYHGLHSIFVSLCVCVCVFVCAHIHILVCCVTESVRVWVSASVCVFLTSSKCVSWDAEFAFPGASQLQQNVPPTCLLCADVI